MKRYPPSGTPPPNSLFHLTAARLRFGMNPKGHGGAAAGDRQRVCRAWHRTGEVKVLVPGIIGAEG
ncbi:MAG: hypothetical protein A3G93_04210 [Nitrospinae bacterium RIFCSPLOWO2_12_FULL_45_22]|nr:MAG: hypothetical protein A3G93_04210 [Nitrospinae bacterium RIFCSPLOWO2_12_FULL_45_22]